MPLMSSRRPTRLARAVGLTLAGIALTLAGCGEQDRDGGAERPLIGKPGVYQGQADQKLSPDQRRALRDRTGLQN